MVLLLGLKSWVVNRIIIRRIGNHAHCLGFHLVSKLYKFILQGTANTFPSSSHAQEFFTHGAQSSALAGGDVVELAGVFVALGVAGSTALARKIGAAVENGRIVTDEKMQTTVPGLYAAGDCTGGLLQVAKAVYEGALAGTEAAKALRKG
jgi:pyruvate/2-oxoglutarate dehydrogenase complex dihydrolipoamide dehydrogenase (E3) component